MDSKLDNESIQYPEKSDVLEKPDFHQVVETVNSGRGVFPGCFHYEVALGGFKFNLE